ncbi:hypothetical protein [Dyadobacter sp. CY326]|uniref:hypothetical protein n=1 Tax=Dyadobacter sp. CY326 TaxID=2907300 RepID=UPI001F41AE30|nr:hypothetical protein [Dyadobacter sp. CY326]MCE7066671.1 hypothetical protein [Dyadobacter sp. CY326]
MKDHKSTTAATGSIINWKKLFGFLFKNRLIITGVVIIVGFPLTLFFWNRGISMSIPEAFPQHFPNDTVTHRPCNYLPEDILVSLPHDFQLANNLGYLTTYIYPDGEVWIDSKSDYVKDRKFASPSDLKKKYKELIELGYNVFQPVQFPHVVCAYPDIDLIDNFEKEAAIDLLKSLSFIQDNDSSIINLSLEIDKVINNISDVSKEELIVDELLIKKTQERDLWNLKISEIEKNILKVRSDIASEQSAISTLQNQSNQLSIAPMVRGEYYDLYKLLDVDDKPISTSNDILKPVHESLQENIENKEYNTPRTSVQGSPLLDHEMVQALDKLNDILKDPEVHLTTRTDFTNDEIRTISDWKKTKMEIISAARSATDQTKIKNDFKTKTLDSKHLIGGAVDFSFAGKPYNNKIRGNSKNYELFVKVAKAAGLHFPLPGHPVEANHATLASLQNGKSRNTENYCKKLNSLLNGYNKSIEGEITRQFNEIFTKKGLRNSTMDKLSNLQSIVKGKLKSLNDVENSIKDLAEKFNLKDQELSQVSNEFCSLVNREKELRNEISRKERALRDRQREHDHFNANDRPRAEKDQPREAPQRRDSPQRESPQRERNSPEPKLRDLGPRRLG